MSRDAPGLMPLLTVASFLSSVALLGGACGAMVLGHWYLVVPSLDVAHLQSIVRLHIGSTVVRVVVVAAAVMIAIVTWEPGVPELRALYFLDRRHFLLAAHPVRPCRACGAVVSDVGDREDSVDAVGDRNPLRRFLHRHRR